MLRNCPLAKASLSVMLLVFINLLEWPVLLSRGYSWGLWLTIPIRTALMMLLGYFWYRQIAPVKDSAANLPAGLQRSPDDSLPYQEY